MDACGKIVNIYKTGDNPLSEQQQNDVERLSDKAQGIEDPPEDLLEQVENYEDIEQEDGTDEDLTVDKANRYRAIV